MFLFSIAARKTLGWIVCAVGILIALFAVIDTFNPNSKAFVPSIVFLVPAAVVFGIGLAIAKGNRIGFWSLFLLVFFGVGGVLLASEAYTHILLSGALQKIIIGIVLSIIGLWALLYAATPQGRTLFNN